MFLAFLSDGGPQIRHGSFYLHLGVATFGMVSIIYSSLQFGQYFELTSKCNEPLMALTPLTKVIFMLQQMVFIFSWSQVRSLAFYSHKLCINIIYISTLVIMCHFLANYKA